MKDIEMIEGRLFKRYSIVSSAHGLTSKQRSHFLKLKAYPKFRVDTTIKEFEMSLFGPGGRLSYAFEEFDEDVPGSRKIGAYQFSPVYAGRIELMKKLMTTKANINKMEIADRLTEMAEQCARDVEMSRASGYETGLKSGVLSQVRQAIEKMAEESTGDQEKYGPLLISDVEKWLENVETSWPGTEAVVEDLILYVVENFTNRMRRSRRLLDTSVV
ncbi:hypothetical protein HNP46_006051 [Pseudomonas nitritireducens]|uniref:Uncharacterized protein n=1 Tax=Pseudomonas nitroreducens TaxID=46680 RepID=A0A7W7P4X8_PSENT|nr:hypothetical protein [Pseudomonas nitritireducens]MBB4867140.1 hypothetical protein [Pseudomonas nitritireducens]